MHKIIFAFILSIIYINASEINLYTKQIKQKNNIFDIESDVIVFDDMYFLRANKAKYNPTNKELELFGDISALRGQNEKTFSQYAKLNIQDKTAFFNDFFFFDDNLEVWFKSEKGKFSEKEFIASNCMVSSCDIQDPDWQIKFKEGKFNKDKNFIHLKNPTFYVKNIPILWLPYFGFSIDNTRKSGFLTPQLSISQSEGMRYEQPFYIVFDDNWDIELNPQIRTNRGVGIYSTLRFINNYHHNAKINFGFFNEKKSFYTKEKLKNKTHKGIELKYLGKDLLKDKLKLNDNFQEALWIDAIYLNDIDYLNVGYKNSRDTTNLINSKINYFLSDDKNYYAAYAKYYIDTSKDSNKDILQEYPSFQYHHFLNKFFYDKIFYSFDTKFHRYYRDIGTYANQLNFHIPISYNASFVNEVFNIKLENILYTSLIDYSNYTKHNEYLFINTPHLVLYTNLAKAYNNFYHDMYFGVDYYFPSSKHGQITQDFLDTTYYSQSLIFKEIQFFYNKKGEKKIKHRLNINYDIKNNNIKYIDNLVEYYFNNDIYINNESRFTSNFDKIEKSLTELKFNFKNIDFNIFYAYKHSKSNDKASFVSTNFNYILNNNYSFFGGVWFDTKRSKANIWEIGYSYQKKCWNYSLMYKSRIDPQLTSAGINAKNKNGLYFTFNFYPLGGFSYDLAKEENL